MIFISGCSDGGYTGTSTTAGAPDNAAQNEQRSNGVGNSAAEENTSFKPAKSETDEQKGKKMSESDKNTNSPHIIFSANGHDFNVSLEDNDTVREFADMLKDGDLNIEMSDYGGFEKVGSLGTELPANNTDITTEPGDIVLYNGSNIVVFYGSNTWSYTKIGSVENVGNLKDALGSGDVSAVFSIEQ